MKKFFILGTMAIVALAVSSCSNKEKCDSACNDGSVVVDESSDAKTLDNNPTEVDAALVEVSDASGDVVDAGIVTVEDAAEQGASLADKTKQTVDNAYKKAKQGVTNAYEKAVESTKNAYEVSKDKTTELIEKSKEKIHKATE